MKKVIIIHGMPSKKEFFKKNAFSESNKHWIPWIQKELTLKGINCQTLEMPKPYQPKWKTWKKVLGNFVVDGKTILIGHSAGAGFLTRFVKNKKIKKVILVAPWINPKGEKITKMFRKRIKRNFNKRIKKTIIIYSTDDSKDVLKSVKIIKTKGKNIKIRKYKNLGHFTA